MAKKKKEPPYRHGELTEQDKFYIENHGNLSVEELASVLKLPQEAVASYCALWLKKNPQKVDKPAHKNMQRPAKGVVAMTEAASSAADDNYGKTVTIQRINQAMADGDHELAKELKKRFDEQEKTRKSIIRNKYADSIHYIVPPDDDDEPFG